MIFSDKNLGQTVRNRAADQLYNQITELVKYVLKAQPKDREYYQKIANDPEKEPVIRSFVEHFLEMNSPSLWKTLLWREGLVFDSDITRDGEIKAIQLIYDEPKDDFIDAVMRDGLSGGLDLRDGRIST